MRRPPCTTRTGDPKKRWPNLNAAVFVAHKMASNRPYSQAVYHCNTCDGYHIAKHKAGTINKLNLVNEIIVTGGESLTDLIPGLGWVKA